MKPIPTMFSDIHFAPNDEEIEFKRGLGLGHRSIGRLPKDGAIRMGRLRLL
jgi:hypothetical protein